MDVFKGQKGRSIVSVKDQHGQETDVYDQAVGIRYSSTNSDVISIADNDANPKDAEIEVVGVGDDVMLFCNIDLDPSVEGENVKNLQAGPFNAMMPPPGQAVDATFDVVWVPAETSTA